MISTAVKSSLVPAEIQRLPWHAPIRWLWLGWCDFRRAPKVSLAYGVAFAVLGYLLITGMQAAGLTHLWAGLAALTALTFPLLAAGLYHVSLRLEWGRAPDFDEAAAAWHANGDQMLFLGLMLMFGCAMWALIQLALIATLIDGKVPTTALLAQHPDAPLFIVASVLLGTLSGGILLAGAAISLPLTLHREIDFVRAIAVSVTAVRRNLPAAGLWAVTVGMLLSFGFASFTLGLVVTAPLLGHATWHAYRDLVEPVGLAIAKT